MEEYGGTMPKTYDGLLKLPGIGSYTAGAVASIAYNIPVPAVDGNVMRVISRLLGSYEDITKGSTKKKLEGLLADTMDSKHPGLFNQALFETGALVCIPAGEPKCGECPLASLCIARQKGLWQDLPVKPTKKPRKIEEKTVLVISTQEKGEWRVALRKRPSQGLLASLYEFPNIEGKASITSFAQASSVAGVAEDKIRQVQCLGESKHIFSHVEWHMVGYWIQMEGSLPETFVSADIRELEGKYPLPNAFLAYRKAFFMTK